MDTRGVHRIFQRGFPKRALSKQYLRRASYQRTHGARKPCARKSVTLRGGSGNSGNTPGYAPGYVNKQHDIYWYDDQYMLLGVCVTFSDLSKAKTGCTIC